MFVSLGLLVVALWGVRICGGSVIEEVPIGGNGGLELSYRLASVFPEEGDL